MKTGKSQKSLNSKERPLYNPHELEIKWQKQWEANGLDLTIEPDPGDKTFYALSMFPYPSGTLHMGHVRNYVITDVLARFHRMKGYKVLQPMGWDAFGLPAENAAIERGVSPSNWTKNNICQMREQLKRLGLSIDWNREFATCDSEYYRWTQYLFLELFDSGLAYQKEAIVNWDPIDKTVLANEQVDPDGKSWRSGAVVEKKLLKQWFLKITDYAPKLLNDLNGLIDWPERVKTMQSNWIGKSEGVTIQFKLENSAEEYIEVFTTRADTLFGVTYLVLAPEHPLLDNIVSREQKPKLEHFKDSINQLSDMERASDRREKCGINIGTNALHPITGEPIPLWVGDYVLPHYGSGIVMGVPAHDQRDFKFAKKYDLPIKYVIKNPNINEASEDFAFTDEGIMFNSSIYNGKKSKEVKLEIIKKGEEEGWAKSQTNYKLRDWLISRQRYWGCPIPIIHCVSCGTVPLNINDLPLKLPPLEGKLSKGDSELTKDIDWVDTICPKCSGPAKRETDTMDTFMCSSWYFLRFTDPKNNSKPFSYETSDKWLPVSQYVGGIEHAILHLLYARFFTKALFDKHLVKIKEPFQKLLTQGMVQGVTYKNPRSGAYIHQSKIQDKSSPLDPNSGEKLEVIYEKMSKSKYNGVDPSGVIDKFGADTSRLFILFKAPPEKDLEWDDADVEGQYRFICRLCKLVKRVTNKFDTRKLKKFKIDYTKQNLTKEDKELRRLVHMAIISVTEDLEDNPQFNTAISELMKLSNAINEMFDVVSDTLLLESTIVLIKLLAPFAPHISEEFWFQLQKEKSVHLSEWPKHDNDAITKDSFELIIQVKGKVRGSIQAPANADNNELERLVLSSEISKKWLLGKDPRRIIIVPGKLVNLVP